MTVAIIVVATLAALAAGAVTGWTVRTGRARGRLPIRGDEPVRTILLPFTGGAISRRAVEAAVRLARAENAVIMPAFLARVPRTLPLDAPLPAQCSIGMPVLEAIEQRLAAADIPVDARIGRGRTYRDALQRLLDAEHFDRVIVSADADPRRGLSTGDIDWLLKRVQAEVMILRPAPTDERRVSGRELAGHF